MSARRLVDILDVEGHPLFRNLLDDGSNVMRFASGHGFVTRDDVDRYRWRIVRAAR